MTRHIVASAGMAVGESECQELCPTIVRSSCSDAYRSFCEHSVTIETGCIRQSMGLQLFPISTCVVILNAQRSLHAGQVLVLFH